jgi:hypothetical protein
MAAPQEQAQVPVVEAVPAGPAKPGPIDQRDVDGWKNRFNDALSNTDKITAPAATDARPWHAGLFDCFNPIDTCTDIFEQNSKCEY